MYNTRWKKEELSFLEHQWKNKDKNETNNEFDSRLAVALLRTHEAVRIKRNRIKANVKNKPKKNERIIIDEQKKDNFKTVVITTKLSPKDTQPQLSALSELFCKYKGMTLQEKVDFNAMINGL